MTSRPRRLGWSFFGAASLGLFLALGLTAVACGEDGVTPDCPPLPLYDIRDENWLDGVAGQGDGVREARERAIAARCMTPLGSAKADAAPPPPPDARRD